MTFDTQKFQKRLEVIAREFGEKKGVQTKIDLKFYDLLANPVPEERVTSKEKILEIIPKKETIVVVDTIPVKTSRKKLTFKKEANKAKTGTKDLKPAQIKIKPLSLKNNKSSEQLTDKKILKGKYTIQVAAYKEFKDAVTQMTILEEKGFSSYRVKGQKEGVTWYRVRTGSFASYDEAKKVKEKLKKAKINSMIIKKE